MRLPPTPLLVAGGAFLGILLLMNSREKAALAASLPKALPAPVPGTGPTLLADGTVQKSQAQMTADAVRANQTADALATAQAALAANASAANVAAVNAAVAANAVATVAQDTSGPVPGPIP